MQLKNDIFRAIADPTRRGIIELVAREPLNINAIADNFKVTRQAVSLHVKILSSCGLISIKREGRERYCEAKLDGLDEVSAWIDRYRAHWELRFDSLENYLNKIQKTKKHGKGKK
jgi:DNA-binding transcriptional ArsR family regulator